MTPLEFDCLLDDATHAVLAVLEDAELVSIGTGLSETADRVNDALAPIIRNLTTETEA